MTILKNLSDYSILVAAERELLRRVLECMLKSEHSGHTLAVSRSSDAISALHRNHYDLILCDQDIKPDAIDLLYRIRSGKAGCVRDIPAIFLTHRQHRDLVDMASLLQVHTCLVRPVYADQLRNSIIEAIKQSVVLREPEAYRIVIEPPSFLEGRL